MSYDAKTQLVNFLAKHGRVDLSWALPDKFTSVMNGAGSWESALRFEWRGRTLFGSGSASRKAQAEVHAAKEVLQQLEQLEAPVDEAAAALKNDAQSGDLLIKLAAYTAMDGATPDQRSAWLQKSESDRRLAALYDRWFEEGDPDITPLGTTRGREFKAAAVEALIWRRFQAAVLRPDAGVALHEIFGIVDPPVST